MKVLDLKRTIREPGRETYIVASVPVDGLPEQKQAIVVPVTKSALRDAIAHLHNKSEIPVALDIGKVIVGSTN